MSMTMVTGGTSGINSDLQLIKMVLNSNVNVPDVALQHMLDMPTQLALTGRYRKKVTREDGTESEVVVNAKTREQLMAVKVMMTAIRYNQAQMFKMIDKEFPDKIEVNDGNQQTATEVAAELRKDPLYVSYLRDKRQATKSTNNNGHKRNGSAGDNGHNGRK